MDTFHESGILQDKYCYDFSITELESPKRKQYLLKVALKLV